MSPCFGIIIRRSRKQEFHKLNIQGPKVNDHADYLMNESNRQLIRTHYIITIDNSMTTAKDVIPRISVVEENTLSVDLVSSSGNFVTTQK